MGFPVSLRYLFISSSIIFTIWDLRSESFSLGVLEYLGLAVVEEIGSNAAILHWLLLIMFLCLSFAIWLLLLLADLSIPGWSRPPGRQVEL